MSPEPNFRCCRCGDIRHVDVDQGRLYLSAERGDEGPRCGCGAVAWARMGSMTEFYRFWQREDVCRLCERVRADVKSFRLLPVASDADVRGTGLPRVEALIVQACPAHVEVLQGGYEGYYLPE